MQVYSAYLSHKFDQRRAVGPTIAVAAAAVEVAESDFEAAELGIGAARVVVAVSVAAGFVVADAGAAGDGGQGAGLVVDVDGAGASIASSVVAGIAAGRERDSSGLPDDGVEAGREMSGDGNWWRRWRLGRGA